jgi:hypothetical protein
MVRRSQWLAAVWVLVALVPWPGAASRFPGKRSGLGPDMPDESHRLMAGHAALSHGLSGELAGWIGQGARDEDHCTFEPYPPCVPWIPSGYHSWDPDTDGYWTEPAWWGQFGSGLSHAEWLLAKAVDAAAGGDGENAYRYLGRAVHMLGDMATPAHVHLDTHLPPFDMDPYELWLGADDRRHTRAWITEHPAGPAWDLGAGELPAWAELDADLQGQLEAASQAYGERSSGEELWTLGPTGRDAVVFRLMYLMAEEGDNWDSDDVEGEQIHGDLDDAAYLTQMRDALFPKLVRYSAALID